MLLGSKNGSGRRFFFSQDLLSILSCQRHKETPVEKLVYLEQIDSLVCLAALVTSPLRQAMMSRAIVNDVNVKKK